MYLKRLDVVGFKSFASRISVEFVPGVTAVVGPNGSGKSNITDAIRWVLGEQSAKSIRGSKMEDIIFSGSDSRKPLNVAEVTLTLQNDDQFLPVDYHEVSVTRRVYRSGESEFYINKQSCRLKDIVDLFMDSGLGREAFSIISQGKVEEILSSKAEERRTIFEEAAGVLKYKNRKKKAEMKLLETQENLNRIEDIIFEIESQMEPLKIQAAVARDYLDQKEQLEKTEVSLLAFEVEELHTNWQALLKHSEELRDQEVLLSSQLQHKEAEIEKMKQKMVNLDESIQNSQETLLRVSSELEKVEGQKQVLRERKKNANQNQEQLEKTLQDLINKEKSYREILAKEEERKDFLTKELLEKEKLLQKLQDDLNLLNDDLDTEIEKLKSDYIDLLNNQATLHNDVTYLNEQLEQNRTRFSKIKTDNERNLELRNNVVQKKEQLDLLLLEKQKQLDSEMDQIYKVKEEVQALKQEYEKKQTQLYKAYQYIQQFRSKKEMLEVMQQDYSGFFQGVKEVLKASLNGVEGAIAELISVEKQYETAIEIALGGAMQHIVVENEEYARKAIQYLKTNKGGRATFLPLTTIKGRGISEQHLFQVRKHPSFVGPGSSLITFPERYREVMLNLLGNVLIATDLKGANELAKLVNYRFKIVTLEGDVVNPGGSMTGGASKQNNTSILGRQRELETTTEKLTDAEAKTNMLEENIKALKRKISEQENFYATCQEGIEALRIEEQELQSEKKEILYEEKNSNEKLTLFDREEQRFQKDEQDIMTRILQKEEALEAIKEKVLGLEETIENYTVKKNSQKTEREQLQLEITELKVRLASDRQENKNKGETIDRLKGEYDEICNSLQKTRFLVETITKELSTNINGESLLEEEFTLKEEEKRRTTEAIGKLREKRLNLHLLLEDHERESKELKRQQKDILRVIQDEEVKATRFDVELETRLNQLREEYHLSFEAAKEKYPLIEDVSEARNKVKLGKKMIAELGTVNLGAIEEHKRISERYSFLAEQQNDLIQAKETLYHVIEEMDQEMTKRFENQFYLIKSHFEHVFKELFGGGRADLQLTNPNDLLNTGVDIVAQPPGKKLQNLSLLSGGERALTAIALLFAILKVRPVPFCVLDEVEAALDDANVNRFALYLKRFSEETQFIVITHRKGTMEESDVLYGVTMQESGVSRLVSVKLEETKELMGS